jgi:hypothetical protein
MRRTSRPQKIEHLADKAIIAVPVLIGVFMAVALITG